MTALIIPDSTFLYNFYLSGKFSHTTHTNTHIHIELGCCLDCAEYVHLFKEKLHLCITVSGEGNGTPLQYSCLENPLDGGAW